MYDSEYQIAITAVDRWLDANCSEDYKSQPLAQDWARVSKMIEELGEAISEIILFTGQNPRKPRDLTARARMLKEIADVITTGTLGIQHFTRDADETMSIIYANMSKILNRNPEILRDYGPVATDYTPKTYETRTICGSMRYAEEMLEVAQSETANGRIILMPFVTDYTGGRPADDYKRMLDEMHRAKIDASKAIIVVGLHIGESTTSEIEYAKLTNKEVLYWTEHFGAIA